MKFHMMLFGLFVSGLLLISNGFCETPANRKDAVETLPQTAPAEKKPPVSEPSLDRRWIIKMEKQPGMPVKKPKFDWTGKDQQDRCEKISSRLAETYRNARDFSIQGDPCKTAHYAKQFLEVKTQCQRDCPEGFLEGSGYSDTIVRNVGTLLELGNRRCLGDRPVQKGKK